MKNTSVHLDPTERDRFKNECKTNKTTMSIALRVMVTFFLSDDTFRDRVVHEANRI